MIIMKIKQINIANLLEQQLAILKVNYYSTKFITSIDS